MLNSLKAGGTVKLCRSSSYAAFGWSEIDIFLDIHTIRKGINVIKLILFLCL